MGGVGGERPCGDGALRGGIDHGDAGDAAPDGLRQPDGAHGRPLRGLLRARRGTAAGLDGARVSHRPVQPRDARGQHRADADAVVLPRRRSLDNTGGTACGEPALERRLRGLSGSQRGPPDGNALAGADGQADPVARGDGIGGEPDRSRGVPGPDRAGEADAARDEHPAGLDGAERGGRPVHGGAAAQTAVRSGLAREQGRGDAAGRGAGVFPGARSRRRRERALPRAPTDQRRRRSRSGGAGTCGGSSLVDPA